MAACTENFIRIAEVRESPKPMIMVQLGYPGLAIQIEMAS